MDWGLQARPGVGGAWPFDAESPALPRHSGGTGGWDQGRAVPLLRYPRPHGRVLTGNEQLHSLAAT